MTHIALPLTTRMIKSLSAGDEVFLSGTILVARDQAHKRLFELIRDGKPLPVSLEGQTIFYMGPSPTPPGKAIGSCGPTTSTRMDPFTPAILDCGVKGLIGKGARSRAVVDSIKTNGAVYFYAYGGCGALYARAIINSEIAAFADLGPEAILKLEVRDFPVTVAIDSRGNSILDR